MSDAPDAALVEKARAWLEASPGLDDLVGVLLCESIAAFAAEAIAAAEERAFRAGVAVAARPGRWASQSDPAGAAFYAWKDQEEGR